MCFKKMIIGLTGTLSSGKGAVAEFLKKKGFIYLSLSDELRILAKSMGIELTRTNLQDLGNKMRAEKGKGYLAELIVEKINSNKYEKVVVDGIRNPGEVNVLKKLQNFYLVAVDAPSDVRFDRISKRGRENDPKYWDEFVMVDNRDRGIGELAHGQAVEECMKMANYFINNNAGIKELEENVNILLSKFGVVEKSVVKKRKDYLDWDDYFMGIALISAKRSKDPSTQVGACVVNSQKKIMGIGYNGFPIGCSDEELPWAREGNFLETKYAYVCHAELNAILNSMGKDLSNCSMYVALFPCNECAKLIIQSGIKEVVYLSDKYAELDIIKASKILFNQAGVRYRKLFPKNPKIEIEFYSPPPEEFY